MIDTKPISSKSVLRYPGGKTRAIKSILSYLPSGLKELCSPFFGGGSLEIYLAAQGVKIYGFDVFYALVNFWQCALEDGVFLADKVEQYLPLKKKEFSFLQQHEAKFEKWERAAAFFALAF